MDYSSQELTHDTKVRVQFHCGKVQENEPIVNYTTSTKIGNAIGKFFGFINRKVDPPLQKADKSFGEKVNRVSRESFS